MRIKVAIEWIDVGPRVMGSMDDPLREGMFMGEQAISVVSPDASDALTTAYADKVFDAGRLASVRRGE